MRDVRDGDVVQSDLAEHRSVERAPWSPAQLVALFIGGLLLIMGGIAMARTGLHFSDLAGNKTQVLGFSQTALLASIEFVVGLILVAAGALPGAPRGTMSFIGVLMLGFGIVLLAQPSTFSSTLGTTSGYGTFMVICGVVLLVAAMLAPTIFDRYGTASARSARTVDSGRLRTR